MTEQYECVIITQLTWEIGKDVVQLRSCHFQASAMPLVANAKNKIGYNPGKKLWAVLNAAPVAMKLLNNLLDPQICFKICLRNDFPYITTQPGAKTWHLAVPIMVATSITMCAPLC